ncbi:MAG TPA: nucleotide excision repair endonuclease [Bdellovibrionota bacterium]|nr:nucleotide excision repair endonuclease [Bdellovibrionota bacterium]
MNSFDRKFGPDFFESLPTVPGVYRMLNQDEKVVYVGKAKNLRRRLGQYRNAKRCKRDRKMLAILKSASRIVFETCATDLDAVLLETRLIQELKPRWNVAGAFSFLYPMVGIAEAGTGRLLFCLSTLPEQFPEFSFHGAYRSREITRDAFFALMRLLRYVGHAIPKGQLGTDPGKRYSYVVGFRQIPPGWVELWDQFFRGQSNRALEELILALLENAGARSIAAEVQDGIDALKRFWKHEAQALEKARRMTGLAIYPVPQKERDLLFLKYRNPSLDFGKSGESGKTGSPRPAAPLD